MSRKGFLADERSRQGWKQWSEQDETRKQLEAYARQTEDGLAYPVSIAQRLAEKHARAAPDFYLILSQDRWLFDRLVRKLPAWQLADVRLMGRRRDTVEGALPDVNEREALRELCEGYDRLALAYAAAGYLAGFEAGKAIGGRA